MISHDPLGNLEYGALPLAGLSRTATGGVPGRPGSLRGRHTLCGQPAHSFMGF